MKLQMAKGKRIELVKPGKDLGYEKGWKLQITKSEPSHRRVRVTLGY